FRDLIDAIATLPIINFPENSSQLNSNKREVSCNKRLRLPRKRLSQILFAIAEILSLDLQQTRLVPLSACETGLSELDSISDEYTGLPSGFLYAGSTSVVSFLCEVSDISTTFLITKFYDNLQQGLSVAVALNQAQRWLRDATGDELQQWMEEQKLPLNPTLKMSLQRRFRQNRYPFQSSFYWAAFCAVGQ
ncbi:CHAT domain-containing protein, partial [Microcoleus sp. herbarium8]|uniref:CHAT domain-containing protein n=1 Tax=Microcoleus sp. herbarium8 TaxID=3055436 RepID=UPI002FD5D6BF